MKTIRTLKVSPNAPDVNSVWLNKNTMKYFNNGEWVTIGGDTSNSDDFALQSGVLEVDITEDQFISIMNGNLIAVPIEGANSNYDAIALKVGNYRYFLSRKIQANGTARYSNETITVETGGPTLNAISAVVSSGVVQFSARFIGLAPEIVTLEIGDTAQIKQNNLDRLRSGFFFTQIDYGYGVGTWQSTTGGFAHITTAYGNEVFYKINIDGSITKDDDYIKPNEPYSLQLQADQIGAPLDDVTASHMMSCGEIIVVGSTGPITYTRTVDSTASAYYFVSTKKDGTTQVLTYTVANKTITASVA